MRKPNLFIVGAPKCATTSLHDYLASHPECFMSKIKEPGYFCRAGYREEIRKTRRFLASLEGYLELFEDALPHHTIVGESTTAYLRSEAALLELKSFSEAPKIVAVVRDPVDLVSSFYLYLRYLKWEPLLTLREAWNAQDRRCAGDIQSRTADFPDCLAYRNIALLGRQIERLQEIFGTEHVLVLVSEDLKSDAQASLVTLESFLGLSHRPDVGLPVRNVARAGRFSFLDNLVKQPPDRVIAVKNSLKRALGVSSLGIGPLVDRYNSVPIRNDVEEELRTEMRAFFLADVKRLGTAINRDLLALWKWNAPPAEV